MAAHDRAGVAAHDLLDDQVVAARTAVFDRRGPRYDRGGGERRAELQRLPELRPAPCPARRFCRRTGLRTNPLRQPGGGGVILGVLADARLQRGLPGEDRLAGRAGSEMLVERHDARQIELLVEVGVQAAAAFGAIHVRTPAVPAADAAATVFARERGETSPCRAESSRSPRSPCRAGLRVRAAR